MIRKLKNQAPILGLFCYKLLFAAFVDVGFIQKLAIFHRKNTIDLKSCDWEVPERLENFEISIQKVKF